MKRTLNIIINIACIVIFIAGVILVFFALYEFSYMYMPVERWDT